jgi:ubiquinone/menaquinone biosynthesis C-methylase UbiE
MRTRRLASLLLALACFGATGCQGFGKLDFSHLGRETWQRPDDVVAALALESGDRVADIGAGKGFFVTHLAQAVGPNGRVYAVEVDSELTEKLDAKFPDANIEVILGEFDDPKLPDGTIDVVLIVNTFHHIEDRPAYFARLRDDLAPGGRVAVIEPNEELGGVLSLFVETGHASNAEGVTEDMRAAGYHSHTSHDFLPIQIFEVFEPDPEPDAD